jgi:sugar (pentulose or hexulose) kinase
VLSNPILLITIMIDVAVGIDIGTSYTKGVARTENGTVVAMQRVRSPQFITGSVLVEAAAWWVALRSMLRGLLGSPLGLRTRSICVSAIAPTLVVFDAAQKDSAYAILYSSTAGMENCEALTQCDLQLTKYRISLLKSAAHNARFGSPCITDLVGYMNWRLSEQLTLNSISLIETGVTDTAENCDNFAVFKNAGPRIVAPREQIGETTRSSAAELGIPCGIPVCGGCSDTMSSVIGAGLLRASEMMLYLGTFGSLMRLEIDVDTLLDRRACPSLPFRWLLSIPGLGPEIESLSRQWFTPGNRLHLFDTNAARALPGAGGTLFLVPRWKEGMTTVGKYELLADTNGDVGDLPRRTRAVLEGIAYAVLALAGPSTDSIKTSGGGARSRIWIDVLAGVLHTKLERRHMTWEAVGTADIAASRLAWECMASDRLNYISDGQAFVSQTTIQDNARRIKEHYHERNWL